MNKFHKKDVSLHPNIQHNVLISPEVTHKSDWTQGTMIEVQAN